MKKILSPFLLVVFIVLAFSCKKEDPMPEYVGTWSDIYYDIDSINTGLVYVVVKESYVFGPSVYEHKQEYKYDNDYVTVYSEKGSLKVDKKQGVLTYTVDEVGFSGYNPSDLKYNGVLTITSYKNQSVESRTYSVNYIIKDNALLILNSDDNQNGKFDVGEYYEFLKIKSASKQRDKIFFLEK